eukprot:scaffold95715_cov33-Tisochrysis_lutea.AAC.6
MRVSLSPSLASPRWLAPSLPSSLAGSLWRGEGGGRPRLPESTERERREQTESRRGRGERRETEEREKREREEREENR